LKQYTKKAGALLLGISLAYTVLAAETDFNRIRKAHGENANKLFVNALQKKGLIPLHEAFARLWLNKDLPKANQRLHDAQYAIIAHEKGKSKMTAKIASSEHVKWQMRTWIESISYFITRAVFTQGALTKRHKV